MRKWTNAAGLLFMAVSAVYSDPMVLADPASPESSAARVTDVKPLNDAAAPTTEPATRPAVAGTSVRASQVNINDAGAVEIHVNDASLVEVLRMLSLQSQKNIIASKDVRGTVTANLYDVTVREALDAILHANGFDYREKGNFIYVYTTKEIADMEKAARVKKTEVFRLYYTPAVNAVNMLKPVLSNEAQVAFTTPAASGVDSSSKDAGGNSHATEDVIVITDFSENLEHVKEVLKEVDRRPQQVLVEAVIMRAQLGENNQLGIDFSAVGGVSFADLANVASNNLTTSGLQQALSGDIINNQAANSVNNRSYAAGSLGGNGLKLGIVGGNAAVFISALEGITNTVVMANPKVLVLNKQRGEVHVGSEQGYQTAITTETTTAQNVQFLETGTELIFRPYIGDNGYIRMEVHPEDSSGSVNAQGLPNKDVTQVTTNVMVKDGNTIVIGGLFREETDRTRNQVPGLGSLPGVGALFRNQTDNTAREEVIILLTPHIVQDEVAYGHLSDEQLKHVNQVRVGMRKGLMPWGSERLAESWYHDAVVEMNKPHPDSQKALWDLNCATNLNPTFGEALQLRTEIAGKEQTAADNTGIRSFVRQAILEDRKRASEPVNPTTQPAVAPRELPTAPESAAAAPQPGAAGPTTRPALAESAAAPTTLPDAAPAAKPSVALVPTTSPASAAADQTIITPLPDVEDPDFTSAAPETAGADAPAEDNKK